MINNDGIPATDTTSFSESGAAVVKSDQSIPLDQEIIPEAIILLD